MSSPQACAACHQMQPKQLRRRLARFIDMTGRNEGGDGGGPSTAPGPENASQAPIQYDYIPLESWPTQRAATAALPASDRQSGRTNAVQSPAHSCRTQQSGRHSASPARSWDRLGEEGISPPYDQSDDYDWGGQGESSTSDRYNRNEDMQNNGDDDNMSDAASDPISSFQQIPDAVLPTAEDQAALPAGEEPATAVASEGGSQPHTSGKPDDLPEIFKKAALRCGLAWPAEEEQATEEPSVWEQLQPPDTEVLVRRRLPLAKGFQKALTLSWKKPGSFTWPRQAKPRKVDCVGQDDLILGGLPLPDTEVATHLLRTSSVDPRHPKFATKRDRDFSAINAKVYDQQASVARALNAMAILQGATTSIINSDAQPSTEDLAELKRLHHETMLLTKTVTEQVGRSMSLIVTLERSMWANLAVKTSSAVKEDLLNLPMDHRGLLIGGLDMLVEAHASGQRHKEAMNALLPTDRAKVKTRPFRVSWTPQGRRFPDWPVPWAHRPTPYIHPQPPASRSPSRSRDADHARPQAQPTPAQPGGGRGGGRGGRGRAK